MIVPLVRLPLSRRGEAEARVGPGSLLVGVTILGERSGNSLAPTAPPSENGEGRVSKKVCLSAGIPGCAMPERMDEQSPAERQSVEALLPAVYAELRRLAASLVGRLAPG